MTLHDEDHPLAGKTVRLNENADDQHRGIVVTGAEFRIENWVDRMDGRRRRWMDMNGNPAALMYGFRAGMHQPNPLPVDDEVIYGKIGAFGHMVHASELGEEIDV